MIAAAADAALFIYNSKKNFWPFSTTKIKLTTKIRIFTCREIFLSLQLNVETTKIERKKISTRTVSYIEILPLIHTMFVKRRNFLFEDLSHNYIYRKHMRRREKLSKFDVRRRRSRHMWWLRWNVATSL